MKSTADLYIMKEKRLVRLFVLVIILITDVSLMAIRFAPAAVASVILGDLGITKAEFGFVMAAVNITVIVCVAVASFLIDRIGLKWGFAYGLLALGLGGSVVYLATDLLSLVLARIIQGLGVAITYPLLGALIMAWFTRKERPYVITMFSVLTFLATAATYVGTAALLKMFDASWNTILGLYGIIVLIVAAGWILLGKERNDTDVDCLPREQEREFPKSEYRRSSLASVLRMPVAWTMTIGIFAAAYVHIMYFSFIPLYLENDRGMGMAEAARLGSLLPFSGGVGVIVFGLLSRKSSLMKHLLWTSCLIVMAGSLGLFFGDGYLILIGLLVAGFGLSAFIPITVNYTCCLPGMTPSLVAAFYVLVNIATYLAGFLSPVLVGWLSETPLGLGHSLALFSCVELLAVFMFLRLPAIE